MALRVPGGANTGQRLCLRHPRLPDRGRHGAMADAQGGDRNGTSGRGRVTRRPTN